MGCRSCGGRRSTSGNKHKLLDENGKILTSVLGKSQKGFNRSEKRTDPNPSKRNIDPTKFKYIKELKMDDKRIDILKHSKTDKTIYIIGYLNGCGACNYMKRLIDKVMTPELSNDIRVFSVEKSEFDESSIKLKTNPSIAFVNHGKLVAVLYGIKNNIEVFIRDFQNRKQNKPKLI